MPHPTPEPVTGDCVEHGFRMLGAADVDELTARAGLAPARRLKIRAAAAVLGFGVTSYVTDELIDWTAAPDDPIYRLVFPDEDMLPAAGIAHIAGLVRGGAPAEQIDAAARQLRGRLAPGGRPRFGEQVVPGVYRTFHDTVLVVPAPGRAGRSYGTTCPGRAGPDRAAGPVLGAVGIHRLTSYLTAHTQVTRVQLTGTDPLLIGAAALRRYLEPLLALGQLACIQLDTSALARWPHRFLTSPDADDTLQLFEQVRASGKILALMAGFSHPRELQPSLVADAACRIRGAGAVICTQTPLIGTVNDAASVWAAMWRAQIRMGMVPGAMVIKHVTGPGGHFAVPLARAQHIFTRAFARVSGLGRTIRGPEMRGETGTVCVDGIAGTGTQKVFVLRCIQARDPELTAEPYFAAYDSSTAWLTELKPASGHSFPANLRG